jgi:hypothetical protein
VDLPDLAGRGFGRLHKGISCAPRPIGDKDSRAGCRVSCVTRLFRQASAWYHGLNPDELWAWQKTFYRHFAFGPIACRLVSVICQQRSQDFVSWLGARKKKNIPANPCGSQFWL